jgi:hypothetical protein
MNNLFIHRDKVNFESANKSIELYEKLLLDCLELKNNYLKNAKNFYNQLTFNDLNKECYFKLYAEINSIDKKTKEETTTTKELTGVIKVINEDYSFNFLEVFLRLLLFLFCKL